MRASIQQIDAFEGHSARDLLTQFTASGEQPPFEEIVRRYAGMVYNVCLRVTKDAHDAEDATQAVFLALASQVKAGKPIKYVGPWLQQVARRLSLDIRRSHTRRKRREEKVAEMNGYHGNGNSHGDHHSPADGTAQDEVRRVLTEELHRLPAKYRMPLILHYFGGMTREEMSRELGVKPNTLGVRVYRGREMLAKRLAGRGIVMAGGVLAVWLAHSAHSAMTERIIAHTASATVPLYVSHDLLAANISTQVLSLAQGVVRAMRLAKIKMILGVAVLSIGALGGAAEALARVGPLDLHGLAPSQIIQSIRSALREAFFKPQFTDNTDLPATQAQPGETLAHQSWPAASEPRAPIRPVSPPEHAQMLASAQPVLPSTLLPRPIVPMPAPATPSEILQSYNRAMDWSRKLQTPPAATNYAASQQWAQQAMSAVAPAPPRTSGGARPSGLTVSAPSGLPSPRPLPDNAIVNTTSTFGAAPGTKDQLTLGPGHSVQSVSGLTLGDAGSATFRHDGGIHDVKGALVLGGSAGGSGVYQLSGSGQLTAGEEYVGKFGSGEFIQDGGINAIDSSLYIGYEGSGLYALSDGAVLANEIHIGAQGSGTFLQSGGTSAAGTVVLGASNGSQGNYMLKKGVLWLDASSNDKPGEAAANTPPAEMYIGAGGTGTLKLGDARKHAAIVETRSGSNLIVRSRDSGSGQLRGWGTVAITGQLTNNGRIIADGYDTNRTLDISSASGVGSTIDNQPGERNGWFARNGGELILPSVRIHPGTGRYVWGEDPNDPLPDLTNSLRLDMINVSKPGDLDVSLVALDRSDLPDLPAGHTFIGAWRLDADEIDFERMDVTIRYDDGLAEALQIDENNLKIWAHTADGWQRVYDGLFRFTDLDLIGGEVGPDVDFLAVSAPEPAGVGLGLLGAWLLLGRRRRR